MLLSSNLPRIIVHLRILLLSIIFCTFVFPLDKDVESYKAGKLALLSSNYTLAYDQFSQISCESELYPYSSYYQAYAAYKSYRYGFVVSLNRQIPLNFKWPFMEKRETLYTQCLFLSGQSLDDRILLKAADSFMQWGDYSDALKALDKLSSANSETIAVVAKKLRCNILINSKDIVKKILSEIKAGPEKDYYSALNLTGDAKVSADWQFISHYPEHEKSKDLAFNLFWRSKRLRKDEDQLACLEVMSKHSDYYASVPFYKGIIKYEHGDFDQAEELFAESWRREASDFSLYWKAKTLLKLNRQGAAYDNFRTLQTQYPFSYYSYLAFNYTHFVPSYSSSRTSDLVDSVEMPLRVRRLMEANALDDAIYELKNFYPFAKYPAYWKTLLRQASSQNDYSMQYRLSFVFDEKLLSYPLAYKDIVDQNNIRNHIDPFLILAVIREESSFNPYAVSCSNAQGLMQLMPFTAQAIATSIKRIPYDLTKPEDNVAFGAIHLQWLVKRIGVIKGVAAYNCGEGALRRTPTADELDLFAESIPIEETRHYVKKVVGSYWTYKVLYEPDKIEPLILSGNMFLP